MGAGIASVSAQAGIDVVLIDRDQDSADKGKAQVHKSLTDQVNKGRMTGAARDAVVARITASADYSALGGCDLVVEAVFEDRSVKAVVTAKAQSVVPDAVFGSNTSTLPITSLAETAKDPAKFIGIHFFSPVERMMLVEIIMGKKTGDQALATALDFVRAIRKTPIVVNDTRGFYANRCVLNYIQEGHLMLLEGIPPAMIENTARMAGMPVGPLSLNDETALDLGLKIVRAAEADLGPKAVNPAQKKLVEDLVEKHGRLGRKNGKGFYDYPQGAPKRLWPGLADLLPKKLSREQVEALDVEELKQRFLVVMAVEAARVFEEGVVTDVREADVGSILGWGFAPYSGGTLSYIDMMGTKKFVELCERLENKHGPRFTPPKLLIDMAKTDDRFYRRFAPGKKAA
jgi:3-hydroxyacyl-CoA dehydrogenase/enoyl-CoA hydratase/3-hydroxybutyryl-CoA epimerase